MGAKNSFGAQLMKPSPIARPNDGDVVTRSGLNLQRLDGGEGGGRLLVMDVDQHPLQKTPAAKWNAKEAQRQYKICEEQRSSFVIHAGDRIRSVNGVNGNTAMLAELEDAMRATCPREVNLMVSRDLGDILKPMAKVTVDNSSPQKPRSPMLPPKPQTSCGAPASHFNRVRGRNTSKRQNSSTEIHRTRNSSSSAMRRAGANSCTPTIRCPPSSSSLSTCSSRDDGYKDPHSIPSIPARSRSPLGEVNKLLLSDVYKDALGVR